MPDIIMPSQPTFAVGDIVRHRYDPSNTGMEAQVVSVSGVAVGGRLLLEPFGTRSNHLTGLWYGTDLLLVRHGTLGEPRPAAIVPPAPLSNGMEDAYPDPEFVSDLAQGLSDCNSGAELDREWQKFYRFLNSAQGGILNYAQYTDGPVLRSGHPHKASNIAALNARLSGLFNCVDGGSRCIECAKLGAQAQVGAADCRARHFSCLRCYRNTPSTASCPECSQISGLSAGRVCKNCCDHVKCPDCEELVRKAALCETCGKAGKCCKCPKCPECLEGLPKVCCGFCDDCCECRDFCFRLTNDDNHSHKLKQLRKFKAPDREKGMTRLLGTEIETASSAKYSKSLQEAVKKWEATVITDGSVGRPGVELVTQPAGGSQWIQMISDLGYGFKDSGARTSSKCGLHVHVDASDLGPWELRRLIKLYAFLEPTLYDAIAPERATSGYAGKCGEKYLRRINSLGRKLSKKTLGYAQYEITPPKVGEKLYDDQKDAHVVVTQTTIATYTKKAQLQFKARAKEKYDESRYAGLNLHSYWFRGTLEFRHHHGTNDPRKIINWGIFVGTIVDFAAKSTDQNLDKLFKSQDPRSVIAKDMGLRAETVEWLKERWSLFASGEATRAENGEI